MAVVKKLHPHDRVILHSFGSRRHGTITKANKVTVLVLFDGADEPERMYLDSLRLETAEDVAKRDHERAMREWRAVQPKCSVARIEYGHACGRSLDEVGARAVARTPTEMRLAAAELLEMAQWFERRPADLVMP